MAKLSTRIAELPPVKHAYLSSQVRSKKEVLASEPIAVIGMSCRFPGGGELPETFWQLLKEGRDATRELPADRWNIDELYDPTPGVRGKVYTRRGGFIDNVDKFEPGFFGITPRDANNLDPQQRLLLEECWRALERAGIPPSGLMGSRTGVFVGLMHNDYSVLSMSAGIDMVSASFNYPSMVAGRIAHTLGLQGPALTLDTACSSSAVCLHLASQSLRNDESDMALVGGVSLSLSPLTMLHGCATRMLSVDGRCKTFDASADGFGRGEGCGVVVLKRLSDALANGDSILGLIRGSATNHDGRSSGLMVPNGRAQERVIRMALESCGVEPDQVSYVEAHGTGTSLGDPIEMEALRSVFGRKNARAEPLVVGSVKTNIGHLEAAAGVAGLIKVLLSLQNEVIPAHLNLKQPNPNIRWDELPVTIPTSPRAWPRGEKRRLAGISSFGYSGTNAHLIVEEAPVLNRPSVEKDRPVHVLTLSAKTEAALTALVDSHERSLPEDGARLGDWCFTANAGRTHFEHRAAVSGATPAELRAALARRKAEPVRVVREPRRGSASPKPVFLFTGQGSLHPGVGRELYATQPAFRTALQRCSTALQGLIDHRLEDLLFGESAETLLKNTRQAQPALVALEYALSELWASWGITPAAVIGHSLGEYAAAAVAGVFSIEDALRLIVERARLMSEAPGEGAMLAIYASEETATQALSPYPGRLSLAALNGPEEVVISGDAKAIAEVAEELGRRGIRCKQLQVSHAFHSPLMESVLAPFAAVLRGVTLSAPRIPLVSPLEGGFASEQLTRPEYWCRHLREPVFFAKGLEFLRAQGFRTYVEVGPAPILAGLGRRLFPDVEELSWLPSLRASSGETVQLLSSLGELYVRGFTVDWSAFDAPFERRVTTLPTYPFQRERYWLEGRIDSVMNFATDRGVSREGVAPMPGTQLPLAGAAESRFLTRLSTREPGYLADHRVLGSTVLPAACYVEMALGAACQVDSRERPLELKAIELERPLIFSEAEPRDVQTVLTPQEGGSRFEIYAQGSGGDRSWSRLSQGRIEDGPASTDRVDLKKDLISRFPRQGEVAPLYEMMSRGGLDYGPSFRIIDELRFGDAGCLAHIRLPDNLVIGAGSYRLHPLILDACFQAIAAMFVDQESQAQGPRGQRMPVAIEQLRWFKKTSSSVWVHVQGSGRPATSSGLISADLRIFGEDGDVLAEVKGLLLKQVDQSAFNASLSNALRDSLFELAWREQPVSTETPRAVAPGRWLLLADTGPVAEQLKQLAGKNATECVSVRQGTGYERIDAGHYRIDPGDPAHFSRLLQDTSAEGAPLTAIAFLWGLDERSAEGLSTGDLAAAAVRDSASALHLVQAMARATWTQRPALWVVTRGAVAALPQDAVDGLAQTPIWGLGRVAAIEHPELGGRLIDLDASEDAPAKLFQLMSAPTEENLLALRAGRFLAARLARPDKLSGRAQPVRIQAEGAYLITGGLGALGLATAEWLVEKGARHLVLVGRGEPAAPVKARLSALTARGCDVSVARTDVSRQDDVQRLVEGIAARGLALKGIFHSAGVLDDGVLLHQDRERLGRVFAPKVLGAWNLHRATAGLSLDLFVLYSSAASLVGIAGQANYVAANAFLDSLAHHRSQRGLSALSINWGKWEGEGMGAKTSPGAGLSPQRALRILDELLTRDVVQMAVLPPTAASLDAGSPSPGHGPLFSELAKQGPSSASATRMNELLEELKRADGERRRGLLARYVQGRLGGLLGFSSDKDIHPDSSLNEMGLDSLRAVELKNRIGRELGVDLPMARFIDGTTLDGIVEVLLTQLALSDLLARPAAEAVEVEVEELTI